MGQESYSFGRLLGKNWTAVVTFVGIAAVSAFLVQLSDQPRDAAPLRQTTAHSQGSSSAAAAAQLEARKLAQEKLYARCNSGAKELKKSSDALVKQGNPPAAMALLADCTNVDIDASNRTLLDAALKTARLQDELNMRKGAAAEKARKKREGVSIGMSQEDVIASSWGKPNKINRTTSSNTVREQWVYGGGYLYFRDGILTTIQN